ncbi:hypothetical protein [Paractinoplanes brasiliensis]|uniref:Uncharacterized protein n=1 Tax=Paractinoplanes brasiliensis TaxID=52695 RepID=A0A4R6JAP2_9ACTN|nr:hypothetical protein [Actinoplanes brasiliensis]TDO32562.1 hypothetical protein C8E87_8028 [Actinoplanes brasiliensis]GID27560.1 hypothetical protein Abr02nite_25430 [Actinoplanes brasiliensis]
MRVELSPHACAGPEAFYPLHRLLHAFAEERHEWAADEAAIAALTAYFEEYAASLAPAARTLGQKAIVDAVWSSGPASDPVRVTEADLSHLAEDLCRAAVLIVEDLQNDGAFVRAVATVFGKQRVLTALRNEWLVLRHGGGTGRFPALVEAERSRFRSLTRVAVIADSDRYLPGANTPIHAKADEFRAVGVAVHVLALREAENYLPYRVLASCGDPSVTSATLTALKQLTPDQRDHFDIKHGFGPRNKPPRIRTEQHALFRDLDPQIRNKLRGGFGEDLLPRLEEHSKTLNIADFGALGAHVEVDLRALLSTIESVI